MNADAIEPTKRYVDSFDKYFRTIPDDHLLATIMNPLHATYGFNDMDVLLEDEVGAELVNRAMIILNNNKTMRKI